jgi:hypothetical protein
MPKDFDFQPAAPSQAEFDALEARVTELEERLDTLGAMFAGASAMLRDVDDAPERRVRATEPAAVLQLVSGGHDSKRDR